MPRLSQIFSQSDCLIRIVDLNSHTKCQTVQIQISWLLRSQLIWIYTVYKGRAYPGSAGQVNYIGKEEFNNFESSDVVYESVFGFNRNKSTNFYLLVCSIFLRHAPFRLLYRAVFGRRPSPPIYKQARQSHIFAII